MTRYDIAKFYGYNSPEEYDEAQRQLHESYVESKERQKPYIEKEPMKIQSVKRGRWKKDTMGYDVYIECSECGTSLSMGNYIEEEWRELMRYCPRCGARMDGDAE